MLSWSARRRLIYFTLVLVAVLLSALGLFLTLKPEPSCTDGRQNQDEAGVDCGGSCPKVCRFEIAPVRVLWSRLLPVGGIKYDVAALISNPNVRHGAQKLKYQFKIWDKSNILINTRSGEVFINPGEELIVFQPAVAVGERAPARASFEFTDAPAWQKIDREAPDITFLKKWFESEPSPRLTAQIKNQTLINLENVEIAAVLLDPEENVVAVSSTFVERLGGGEAKELVFTWPALDAPLGIGNIELYAHFDYRRLPADD